MAVTPRPYSNEKSGWTIADASCVKRRAWVSLALLALAFSGLIVRLWYLQVVQGAQMLAQAQHNRLRPVPLPAPRGLILDRNGQTLATSRTTHSVAIVPAALPSIKRDPEARLKVLRTLGFLIKLPTTEIERRLQSARDRGAHIYDPIRIVEGADLATLTLIEENKWRLGPAVLVTDDLSRAYPQGAIAAHVLGYTGIVTERDLERNRAALDDKTTDGEAANDAAGVQSISAQTPPIAAVRQLGFDDIIGKSGIEKQYDAILSGERGSEQYEVDSRLRPVRRREPIPEKPGRTVKLSLDTKLQRAAENALRAARNSGAVAVIDPRNGEVLALASSPTFDPNLFSRRKKDFQRGYLKLVENPKHPLINRAVSSRFPPGSTFKMVTAAAALQKGLNPHNVYACGGGLRLNRRFFGCWKSHHPEDLLGAIADSCNVYFYQSALRLGEPQSSGPTYLAQIARGFGLGRETGIDLPVSTSGLIPDPAWRRKVNAKRPDLAHWYAGNTLNMSIGQGDVLASPLQMALVTGAVANGGTLWQPRLLQSVRDSKGKTLQATRPRGQSVGIAPQNLETVRVGMRRVVTSGTGRSIALPQVAIAGKTGSAEDVHNVLPHAWFVCFAPYDPTGRVKPRIAIAAIVENSGHGSENAVPVCKKILEAAFPAPKTSTPRS